MRVFLYEYLTGGGMWEHPGRPTVNSLFAEGRAMMAAVAADFVALPQTEVWTMRDVRVPESLPAACRVVRVASAAAERAAIERLAASADWTVLIAPETAGVLLTRCQWAMAAGGQLLSPPEACIAIAADKQATAKRLAARGVPTPRGALVAANDRFMDLGLGWPLIAKPVDGCGSQGVRLVANADEWARWVASCQANEGRVARYRVEEYVPGLPASVAVLSGPTGNLALAPCVQRLSNEGRFTYLGGSLPMDKRLAARARHLALAAIDALPQPVGYFGVDLVLGTAPDGSGDRVIEINPRLTTSYVGLRVAARENLAVAMLAIARGQVFDVSFGRQAVQFSASGSLA